VSLAIPGLVKSGSVCTKSGFADIDCKPKCPELVQKWHSGHFTGAPGLLRGCYSKGNYRYFPFLLFGTLPAFPSGTEDFSVFSTTTFLFRGEQT
jgi:hypothetical protein